MNILYIAFSCSPIKGSEDRVGWNIPLEASKRHNVIILTKEEQRGEIEPYMKEHKIDSIEIFYVDIPKFYKKIFNGFLYSARLNVWHTRALKVAKKICKEKNIQIVHQLTPMEFRAIGDYGAIPNVKYVCGPLGGGEYVPDGLWGYTKGHRSVEYLRKLMNIYYNLKYKMTGRYNRVDHYIYANKETREYVGRGNHIETEMAVDFVSTIIPEKQDDNKCVFLVAGRVIYRKGHTFLFDAIKAIKAEHDFEIRILGNGPDMPYLTSIYEKDAFLQKHVTFVGRIPFTKMKEEYDKANVFLMPSIRETTGSVLLEAMSNGLPIIAMDRFGSGILLHDDIGWTFGGTTKQDFIDSFAKVMSECIDNPEEVRCKGMNMLKESEKYTWAVKVGHFEQKYKELLNSK